MPHGPDLMQTGFVQVQTTIDDHEAAAALIRAAVKARLAACGQLVGPIESTYWWRGSLERATEWLCIFKTRAELAGALEVFVRDAHPYEVPEIATLGLAGVSEEYGDWIDEETAAE